MDLTEFNDIAPFNDEETAAALSRLANHPNTSWISRFIFPDKPASFLAELLRSIKTVDDFQHIVMSKAIEWVISTTMKDFSYDGLEYQEAEQQVLGHVQSPGHHSGSGHHAGNSHA